jgi:hypothetical protein
MYDEIAAIKKFPIIGVEFLFVIRIRQHRGVSNPIAPIWLHRFRRQELFYVALETSDLRFGRTRRDHEKIGPMGAIPQIEYHHRLSAEVREMPRALQGYVLTI